MNLALDTSKSEGLKMKSIILLLAFLFFTAPLPVACAQTIILDNTTPSMKFEASILDTNNGDVSIFQNENNKLSSKVHFESDTWFKRVVLRLTWKDALYLDGHQIDFKEEIPMIIRNRNADFILHISFEDRDTYKFLQELIATKSRKSPYDVYFSSLHLRRTLPNSKCSITNLEFDSVNKISTKTNGIIYIDDHLFEEYEKCNGVQKKESDAYLNYIRSKFAFWNDIEIYRILDCTERSAMFNHLRRLIDADEIDKDSEGIIMKKEIESLADYKVPVLSNCNVVR